MEEELASNGKYCRCIKDHFWHPVDKRCTDKCDKDKVYVHTFAFGTDRFCHNECNPNSIMRTDSNADRCVCDSGFIFDGHNKCVEDNKDSTSCKDMFKFDFPQGKWCSKSCKEDKGMKVVTRDHDKACEC